MEVEEIEKLRKSTDEELVKTAGGATIGTDSGKKAQFAQAELMRRLMDAMKELNQTSSKYSKILIWLTVILGILAGIQIWKFR